MVDEKKLAKAGDTLKGQGQQDAPRPPADLAVSERGEGGAKRPAAETPKPAN